MLNAAVFNLKLVLVVRDLPVLKSDHAYILGQGNLSTYSHPSYYNPPRLVFLEISSSNMTIYHIGKSPLIWGLYSLQLTFSLVLIKFTAQATPAQKHAWYEGITSLSSSIPEIKEIISGKKLPHFMDGGWDNGKRTSFQCLLVLCLGSESDYMKVWLWSSTTRTIFGHTLLQRPIQTTKKPQRSKQPVRVVTSKCNQLELTYIDFFCKTNSFSTFKHN